MPRRSFSFDRWVFALDASGTGVWELDLVKGTAWRSIRHDQIFGYPELLPEWNYSMFMQHVVSEDRASVNAAFEHALAELGEWAVECRITRLDGQERWIAGKGRVFAGADGEAAAMFGTVQDITERKETEQALRENEARLRVGLKNANVVAAQMDRELRYQWIYNPHADFDAQAVLGKRDDELEDSAGVRRLIALKRRVIESGRGERETIRFDRSNGLRIYDIFVEPIHDAYGEVVGVTSSSFDVTERVLAEVALEKANAALGESARRKDDFLATLAHELRNPLAPIQSGIDVLRITSGEVAAVKQMLPMMQRQMTQLKHLVDDLMDVSRLMRGKIALKREPVDLRIVLQDVVQDLVPNLERNVDLQLPDQPLVMHGDAVRVRQIFDNLLSNAIKYTEEGGNICVHLAPATGTAIATVQDDGQGIGHDFLSRIFDPFEQEQAASEGLGIGLALVRQLVEQHGGTVEARSGGPGRGSEFVVRMPLIEP
jgi:PAS domain S-box-containing protein